MIYKLEENRYVFRRDLKVDREGASLISKESLSEQFLHS